MPLALPPDLPVPPPAIETAAPQWEGAIGLNLSHRPEYSGAQDRVTKLSPGFFLRYGRFTLTNASGFVTRRNDDVVRGLGLDLLNGQRFRANLALRFDAGRSESTSGALAGLGDIQPTARVRLNLGWRFDDGWRAGAAWSVDAFGRGGGSFGDVSLGYERKLTPRTTVGAGLSLSMAADRYLQTYYGVSPAQAARTGYAVYEPGNGLRDVSAALNLRTDLDPHWLLLGGLGVSRLLGPAAASPYAPKAANWSASMGLAYRF